MCGSIHRFRRQRRPDRAALGTRPRTAHRAERRQLRTVKLRCDRRGRESSGSRRCPAAGQDTTVRRHLFFAMADTQLTSITYSAMARRFETPALEPRHRKTRQKRGPAGERVWRDDRHQFIDGGADHFSKSRPLDQTGKALQPRPGGCRGRRSRIEARPNSPDDIACVHPLSGFVLPTARTKPVLNPLKWCEKML